MKQKVICLISILAVVSCFFFMPKIKAETLQDRKNENEQKQQESEKKLEYVKSELSEALIKIQELDDQIRESEKEIQGMDKELLTLQDEVKKITEDLNKVQKTYEENQKMMEKRMVVMYETGDITYLDLLLHSSNIVEFLSNYYIIEQIIESENNPGIERFNDLTGTEPLIKIYLNKKASYKEILSYLYKRYTDVDEFFLYDERLKINNLGIGYKDDLGTYTISNDYDRDKVKYNIKRKN